MIKSFSFIVLALFFRFNQLKILRQPGYLIFFTVYLKAQYNNFVTFFNSETENRFSINLSKTYWFIKCRFILASGH